MTTFSTFQGRTFGAPGAGPRPAQGSSWGREVSKTVRKTWRVSDHQGQRLSGEWAGVWPRPGRRLKSRPFGRKPAGRDEPTPGGCPRFPQAGGCPSLRDLRHRASRSAQNWPVIFASDVPNHQQESQAQGRNAAHCPGRPLHPQGHPKILSNRSAKPAPQKASSGPTLARGASADPAGLTARARPEARPDGRAANLRDRYGRRLRTETARPLTHVSRFAHVRLMIEGVILGGATQPSQKRRIQWHTQPMRCPAQPSGGSPLFLRRVEGPRPILGRQVVQ